MIDRPIPAGDVIDEFAESRFAGDAGIEHRGGEIFAAGTDHGMLWELRSQINQQRNLRRQLPRKRAAADEDAGSNLVIAILSRDPPHKMPGEPCKQQIRKKQKHRPPS